MPLLQCVPRWRAGFVQMDGSVCSKSSPSIANSSQRGYCLLQRVLICSRMLNIDKLPHIGAVLQPLPCFACRVAVHPNIDNDTYLFSKDRIIDTFLPLTCSWKIANEHKLFKGKMQILCQLPHGLSLIIGLDWQENI